MKWYLHAFRNSNNYYGRASRTEYWMYQLMSLVVGCIFMTLDMVFDLSLDEFGLGPFYLVFALVSLLPGLAVAVRRLHDTGRSGWYLLLGFVPLANLYLLALLATKGEAGENAYDDEPDNEAIAPFIHTDGKNTVYIAAFLLYEIVSSIASKVLFSFDFYQSHGYKIYNEIQMLVWGIAPIVLASTVKDRKWKTILLILTALLLMYRMYEMLKFHHTFRLGL